MTDLGEEITLSSTCLYDGRILRVERDTVRLSNGAEALREVVRHLGAVAVLPLSDDGQVTVEEQYRYGAGQVLTEIPAGKLDRADEDPLEAAKRELREETGMSADRWTYLGLYYGSPAILSEKIHLYLAEGLHEGECDLDEDELLTVSRIPLDALYERVLRGDIPDGKTQCAVLRVYAMRKAPG